LPYFIPEVVLFNNNNILYTDVNKKGEQGIILLNRETKKKELFLQSDVIGQTFQLCQNDDHVFILQTGQSNYRKGTQIYMLPKTDAVSIKSLKSVYASSENDVGHMVCDFDDKYLYFIKSKQSGKYSSKKDTVAQIDLKTQALEIIYDEKISFNLLQLDKKLLVTTQGKYYILKGSVEIKDDSIK